VLQSRSQTLQKQLQEMHEQIEQTVVEMKTFESLRQHEVIAVPKRVEVCSVFHSSVIYTLLSYISVTSWLTDGNY